MGGETYLALVERER